MEIAQPPVRVDQAVVCWQLSFHLKIIRKIAERNDLIKLDTFIYNYERQRTLTKHLYIDALMSTTSAICKKFDHF